jgi:hypothetical protein
LLYLLHDGQEPHRGDAMRQNEIKGNASSFASNIRAEDVLWRNPEESSLYQDILIPLGVIAAIFLSCLLVALIRC